MTNQHRLVTPGNPSAPADIPDGKVFDDNQSDYIPAPEIEAIAHALIENYPDELGHLTTAAIRCVWKGKGKKDCGKPVLGTCARPPALTRFFAGCDFIVTLMAEHCTSHALTNFQVEALVFHELLHADVDPESGRPSTRPHDCEMFHDEIKYYGLWKADLREARIAFDQQPLPLFGASKAA